MKITFLGTRGYIEARTRRHFRHTATLIEFKNKKIMIDCGLDWAEKVWLIKPDAIVITHAHPDHAFGLRNGSPCPVYATSESWRILDKYPIQNKNLLAPYEKKKIQDVWFETFPVVHSLLAPGVGYRITAAKTTIFCVHDIISIDEPHLALNNVQLYIGDGASVTRPLVRRRGNQLFGHTTVRAQLGWCQKEEISRMIVTHCGTQIVEGGRHVTTEIKRLAQERGVSITVAYDGMEIIL